MMGSHHTAMSKTPSRGILLHQQFKFSETMPTCLCRVRPHVTELSFRASLSGVSEAVVDNNSPLRYSSDSIEWPTSLFHLSQLTIPAMVKRITYWTSPTSLINISKESNVPTTPTDRWLLFLPAKKHIATTSNDLFGPPHELGANSGAYGLGVYPQWEPTL